ncbi:MULTISPECIES: ATP-binding protein [unclassified Sphingomonas]|uniref:ATP-binding protein n=1 Tax=Novosphingobium rhizosphaerae TaxID=1551649 RepID=UPI0015CECB7E
MTDLAPILATIAVYVGVLSVIGWRADRRPASAAGASGRWRGMRYGLSLATLCSAWTYFGAVGDASEGSWLFVANALGPVLALTLLAPVWRRIALLAKQENVGSLADFLAARFGKSRALGILASLVATLAALPYIALQLKVLADVWGFASARRDSEGASALAIVVVLVVLAMAFGTRRPSLTQHSRGFVSMIAVESLVKLAGLGAVAALVVMLIAGAVAGGTTAATPHLSGVLPPLQAAALPSFATLTALCTITAFTLPRQFHLGFVTLERAEDIRWARRVVPAYFALWVLATLTIAMGIRAGLGGTGVAPYLQLLAIPMQRQESVVSALALLGGLSAGGAMVVVELTAISAMVSNEVILPILAGQLRRWRADQAIGAVVVAVRRVTVVLLAALAWFYYLGIRDIQSPTELGLTALTASAQLVPPLIGGIYWRRAHARGAIAGVAAGILVWLGTIAIPAFTAAAGPVSGGGSGMWPVAQALFVNLAIFASLLINTACFIAFSLGARPRLIDEIQANRFVLDPVAVDERGGHDIGASVGDLRRLLEQFIGVAETQRTLADFHAQSRRTIAPDAAPVSPALVRAGERVLAGVIGAPSARNVVAIAMAQGGRDAEEIGRILDEASHAVQFSRELLQTTLESLPQGVCVLDAEGQLVVWNAQYMALMGIPPDTVAVGRSHGGLLAAAGLAQMQGPAMQAKTEITRADGRVLAVSRKVIAGGDVLLTVDDVTEIKRAQAILTQDRSVLEKRVDERTRALTHANSALEEARRAAEQATRAQRRFVAAASHDLVQPMHAARLFIGNATLGVSGAEQRDLLEKADQAVEGAHRMLQALLTLSRLELGALQPRQEAVDVNAVIHALAAEFAPVAAARGLQLVVLPTRHWVRSDRDLLRSILQNLLVNALRYTPQGRIVMLARRRGAMLRIEVRDSGVGMAESELPLAFREFSRLPEGQSLAEGTGLGLAIVARIAGALGHPLDVHSRKGAGSVFALHGPLTPAAPRVAVSVPAMADLAGIRVLCLDDDADILIAMSALIERWGGVVTRCRTLAEVPANGAWDAAIADYLLDEGNGLDLLRTLAGRCPLRILVTATADESWGETLEAEGIVLLDKPTPPLALQALLVRHAPAAAG